MEFKELIDARRSVRSYESGIEHDALVQILKEAQRAPSWKNQQTSRCYAVETPEILEDLRAAALPSFNRNSSAHAALIVTTYVRNVVGFQEGKPVNEIGNGWGAYDLGLHDAYLVLAAANAGYDTLIMGMRDSEAIRSSFGIPESETVMTVIALGYRAGEPRRPDRRPLDEVVTIL